MISPRRCQSRSPATARRCTLADRHTAAHERRRRSGGLIEEWARSSADADHSAVCTLAELLEHLSDLIELARHAGQGRMVGSLVRAEREIRGLIFKGPRRRGARPAESLW